MLGALLFVGQELIPKRLVFRGIVATTAGAGNWPCRYRLALDLEKQLRGCAHDLMIAEIEVVHVRRGTHAAQPAIQGKGIAIDRDREPLRQDDLENITALDVLFATPHYRRVTLASHVTRDCAG